MQDPTPIPWGAQDRFQAHYIVRVDAGAPADYLARTRVTTRGRFGAKTVEGITWEGGGRLADVLGADAELGAMISKQSVRDAAIYVEPTDGAVRIRGGWANHLAFGVTKDLYAIYDRIAGHVKSL